MHLIPSMSICAARGLGAQPSLRLSAHRMRSPAVQDGREPCRGMYRDINRKVAQIHLLARIIELRLQNLRVIKLFLKRLDSRRPRLPAKKNLYREIQRYLRFRG